MVTWLMSFEVIVAPPSVHSDFTFTGLSMNLMFMLMSIHTCKIELVQISASIFGSGSICRRLSARGCARGCGSKMLYKDGFLYHEVKASIASLSRTETHVKHSQVYGRMISMLYK